MFAIVKNNIVERLLSMDVPFTLNSIQYPASWLRSVDLETKHQLGIYEVIELERKNEQFYLLGEESLSFDPDTKTVTRTFSYIEKNLEDLKNYWLSNIKSVTYNSLQSTDWCIIRKMDIGTEIPIEISTYRSAVRNKSEEIINNIKACSTVQELQDCVSNIQWPERG